MIEKTFWALQYSDTGELLLINEVPELYSCKDKAQYNADLIMQYHRMAYGTFRSLHIISVNLSPSMLSTFEDAIFEIRKQTVSLSDPIGQFEQKANKEIMAQEDADVFAALNTIADIENVNY
jgi:hypothetical protein